MTDKISTSMYALGWILHDRVHYPNIFDAGPYAMFSTKDGAEEYRNQPEQKIEKVKVTIERLDAMNNKISFMTKISQWIADHLPRKVVYLCGLRLMAHAAEIIGDDPSYVLMGDALGMWEDKK